MQNSVLLFLNIGTPELLVILFVALLLFGGKKLPELARGLGQGIREFKDASDGVKREIHRNINAINDDLDVDVSSPATAANANAAANVTPVTNENVNSEINKSPETDQAKTH